ncbi:MAG: phosphotransferase, partial [Coprococcus sp.]
MNSYDDFLKKRNEIGSGMAAKVYSYNGFAYKCYNEDYPKEWIDYEYEIQCEIMKSELPVPSYYKSEFPNSIKMDLINGISMYDRLQDVGKDIVMAEMMIWFEKIHQVKDLKLHSVSDYILSKIEQASIGDEEKNLAMQCLSIVEKEINEPEVLCHMDYHFLNVMYEEDEVHIIDWTNAKNGKAIWD